MSELSDALQKIPYETLLKLTLSVPRSNDNAYQRAMLRRIGDHYQIERFTEKQAFHENLPSEALISTLEKELTDHFTQLNAVCVGFDYAIRITKKGAVLSNRKKNEHTSIDMKDASNPEHNRKKTYLLEEGSFVPALYELGVITSDGKVVSSRQDKFRQINRFTEYVDDVISKDCAEDFEIVDFGCGKSYLTFVLYHYMTAIKKARVNVTGLDLKADVIKKCNEVAEKYGYDSLHFYCGDIKDFVPQKATPDMVITLHACDTATDYALYNAIRWKSRYIFSVPCCQHELNGSISFPALSVMTDYGLIKERFCALATDAIRAKLLEYCGYKVDILEFVDMDNSPKNILLRARYVKEPNPYKKNALLAEINAFEQQLGAKLTLQRLLQL